MHTWLVPRQRGDHALRLSAHRAQRARLALRTPHTSAPTVDLDLLDVEHFWRIPGGPFQGNDEAVLALNITANLTSVFTWNTKQLFVFVTADFSTPKHPLNQVSLWDAIIRAQGGCCAPVHPGDQRVLAHGPGQQLASLPFNLTVYWNVMPIVGGLSMGKVSFSGFSMPPNYRPFHLPRDPSRFGAHHMHDMHFENGEEHDDEHEDGEGLELEEHEEDGDHDDS
ncbi:hypothetical protein CLOM_g6437 [Closterium sp. NIES-68]|nr:hypothetical protein CLOM_g6437 [Closterium sp. NIES-68]